MPTADPALETLFLPLSEGRLDWPGEAGAHHGGGVLFLRAREGAALHARPRPGLVAEQSFRPDAEALQRAGIELAE
ncbi:MAG: 16S rRNA methyltransferase, partial [Proteobacteria bacterium]|nr:16S rRNA methyltransferase [Pseudomonadota bacterium]